jgi:hypothetical protein
MARVAESAERRDALVERLFANAIGAFDLFSVYLGDVLGLYRMLAERGPMMSAELGDEAGLHERYAREWLEQQAASRLLEVAQDGDTRRFRSPAGHDEALLDVSSLNYVAPMARAVLASIRPVDKVLEAFRTGDGVPYADYGDDLHEAQAALHAAAVRESAREGVAAGGGRNPLRLRPRSRVARSPGRGRCAWPRTHRPRRTRPRGCPRLLRRSGSSSPGWQSVLPDVVEAWD